MNVTVEVVGEGSHDLEVEDATYADLLAEVDLSPHEVSVMVEGRPVPEDQPVEADHVKVLRLIKGGSGETQTEAESASGFDRPESEQLGVSALDFELPNAGAGPDPLWLSALARGVPGHGGDRGHDRDDSDEFAATRRRWKHERVSGNDAVVLLFHRDYHCRNCREQVQEVADRYGEFRDRNATVVSVLPESKGKAAKWQGKLHLPFPLVADAEKTVGEQYGQPTRFGALGKRLDLLGRLPEVAILDARDGLRLYAVHRGDSPSDRPSVDDVLAMLDRMLADER